jgi:tetraprenyl-beta-curcumene synthase
MSNLINCLKFTKNYSKIIYPIVHKRISEYRVYTNRIKMQSMKSNALQALNKNRFDLTVSSVLSLYPKIDIALATEVIFSFQALVQYLNMICEHSSASTESFLKLIFSSLKDATNLRTEAYEKYFTFFPSKDDDGYLSILVEKCRQKVRLLPSFDIIRDYVATYLSLFIDLQVTKYSSDEIGKEINLLSWSCAHGQNYLDISNWEFCMSVDSPLTLQFLLALATDPDLTEQELESVNNAFFPWVSGIQKILEGYLNYNDDLFSRDINYIFYYKNLKEYEDRIIYFIDRAAESQVSNSDYYFSILKILLSIYVTHPKANDGMNKLTSKALLQAGGKGMHLYSSIIKLIWTMKKL